MTSGGGGDGLLARVARTGPPRRYVIDGEAYELTGSWWPLVDGLSGVVGWRLTLLLDLTHPDDGAALLERLTDPDDPLAPSDLDEVVDALVLQATGRPWWVAGRLLASAVAQWAELDGKLTGRGVDLAALIDRRPDRACNVVYAWLIEGADRKERDKFDAKLTRPPAGELRRPSARTREWMEAEEAAAFAAALNAAQAQGLIRTPAAPPAPR